MRASKGGLTHDQILRLSWRQFQTYLDSFAYLLQEESTDGRQKNRLWDARAMAQDPRVRAWKDGLLAKAKAALKSASMGA